jgi:hypothetical protein
MIVMMMMMMTSHESEDVAYCGSVEYFSDTYWSLVHTNDVDHENT